jgi:phosphate transport system substrate-binding protein
MMSLCKRLGTVILLSVCPIGLADAVADPIIIQGSSTFNRQIIEPLQSAIETVSKHELTVIPNRTSLGLIALMEGRAQMAMISAPLQTEIDNLQQSLPGLGYEKLKAHEILNTRVAIGVNKQNTVRKLTLDQIKKILTGEINSWALVGGDSIPIRLVLVGGGGGVTSTVESAVLGTGRITAPNVLYVKTAIQLAQVIEQEPTSLGIGQLLLIQQRGIPEIATDRPIEQQLAVVTLGNPSPQAQDVIDAMRKVVGKSM